MPSWHPPMFAKGQTMKKLFFLLVLVALQLPAQKTQSAGTIMSGKPIYGQPANGTAPVYNSTTKRFEYQVAGGGGGATPGGAPGSLQINNGAGTFAGRGLPCFIDDGSNFIHNGCFGEKAGANAWSGPNDFSTGSLKPPERTYAGLGTASTQLGRIVRVTDALTTSCAAGGGTATCVVMSDGAAWVALGGGATLPISSKGQLVTHDGSSTVALSPGTNGRALVADSSQTSGLRYAPGSYMVYQNALTAQTATASNTYQTYTFPRAGLAVGDVIKCAEKKWQTAVSGADAWTLYTNHQVNAVNVSPSAVTGVAGQFFETEIHILSTTSQLITGRYSAMTSATTATSLGLVVSTAAIDLSTTDITVGGINQIVGRAEDLWNSVFACYVQKGL